MKKTLLTALVLISAPFTMMAEDEEPWQVIVNEDFSGLTDGTEDEPDMTKPLLDAQGWIKDASVLKPMADDCAPGWGGYGAYPAGGCIALIDGFLNTPTGNYSGNLRMSFRARLLPTEAKEKVSMDILLCRRSVLIDYTRKPVELTHEWQTFTMEANDGWYTDCMVQFYTEDDTQFLLDDIFIEHQILSIEPPRATDPFNVKDDSFTAFWNKTKNAKQYLLSVYSKNDDGTLDYFLEDYVVPGGPAADSCDVKGLDPAVDYWYSLKARNDQFTSESGREKEVFDVSDPIALPATNVTANSYTANWKSNPKVDYFRVDQYRQKKITESTPDYVILDEDFSKVVSTGDIDDPEFGEYSVEYESIDQYTQLGGWTGTSLLFADGMLGGMEKKDTYVSGCLVTPILDLKNNNGTCNIAITAYGVPGDWLVIQGNESTSYAGVQFPDDGYVSSVVTITGCGSEERFYLYSNNYMPFLIDRVTITQTVKKNDIITIIDKSVTTDATARQCQMENVDLSDTSQDILYKVVAYRVFHGNMKDIWGSPDSNAISVRASSTGINSLKNGNMGTTTWYDLNGRKTGEGAKGVVIEYGNGHARKVLK